MYINDLDDLYDRTAEHIDGFGRCLYFSRDDSYVQFLLYGTVVFRVRLPREPYTSLSFQHVISETVTTQKMLSTDLAFVENTQEDFSAAVATIHAYARLLLPDKFPEAFEAGANS